MKTKTHPYVLTQLATKHGKRRLTPENARALNKQMKALGFEWRKE